MGGEIILGDTERDNRRFAWLTKTSSQCAAAFIVILVIISKLYFFSGQGHRFPTLGQAQSGSHGQQPLSGQFTAIDEHHDSNAANPTASVHNTSPALPTTIASTGKHPIDDLVIASDIEIKRLLDTETDNVASAAAAYRARRGRHPPPRFDAWYQFAKENDALIIEEFFDQIYHDLEPFWGMNLGPFPYPEDWPFSIHIRNGKTTVREHPKSHVSGEWERYWLDMISQISEYLPDVDMAFNDLDEARIAVAWEDINEKMKRAAESRNKFEQDDTIISDYAVLPPVPGGEDKLFVLQGVGFRWENDVPYWEMARHACPPDSEARNALLDEDMSVAPTFPQEFPANSYHGFVANWTSTKSVCEHPHLRNMHGNFVAPRYDSVNTTLFPLFSGCKVQGINNEILVPAAKYWSTNKRFVFKADKFAWEDKQDEIYWRGMASGGWHRKTNWKRFHRHRFIAMLNGTEVEHEERSTFDHDTTLNPEPPHNMPLPNGTIWDLGALQSSPTTLGSWVAPLADAGFNHFQCHPWRITSQFGSNHCPYTDAYYALQPTKPLDEGFKYKYLPDIDGNSYSGRFRAYMQSDSLPIKATIWAEWHDTRLIPWKHFVPLDNTFADWWAVLEYLVGFKSENGNADMDREGHDEVAKAIAKQGAEWSAKVLRNEDMLVYMYRLILEYARVCSENREKMAYVDDLV